MLLLVSLFMSWHSCSLGNCFTYSLRLFSASHLSRPYSSTTLVSHFKVESEVSFYGLHPARIASRTLVPCIAACTLGITSVDRFPSATRKEYVVGATAVRSSSDQYTDSLTSRSKPGN